MFRSVKNNAALPFLNISLDKSVFEVLAYYLILLVVRKRSATPCCTYGFDRLCVRFHKQILGCAILAKPFQAYSFCIL